MKTKLISILTALGLFLSVLAIPIKADVASYGQVSFGLAAGVVGNVADFDTTGKETEGTGDNEVTNASVSESVSFGSVFIEGIARTEYVGLTLGYENVPVGQVLGNKTRTDSNDAKDTSDDGTYRGKAEISSYQTIYIEPTIYIPNPYDWHLGIYGKVRGSRVDVRSLESIALGTNSSAYGNESVWGDSLGVGIRAKSPWGILLKIEYVETEYGTVKMTSATGNKNTIEATPEQKAARLSLGYQF